MTEHKNIYSALAAAQADFSAPKKDSTNPAFKSKYADLSSVVEAVAPALSRHGVAFVHYTAAVDLGQGPEACMVTALIHGSSDTRMECAVPLIVSKKDMQGFKSATTYAKRIGLESVTGVAPEDDDGNAAAKAPPAPRQQPPAKISAEQYQQITDLIERTASDEAKLCAYWKVADLHELTAQQAEQTVAMLTKKLGAE